MTTSSPSVAILGAGQLGHAVAERLRQRGGLVIGPAARADARTVLESGADVVVVATTTRLADVIDDVRTAVRAGSNVIVSAEESSYPWAVAHGLAEEIDSLARRHSVTVVGGGVNPGLIFDALVLTLLGTTTGPNRIGVRRTVDISGFGPVVLGRLGVGYSGAEFQAGVTAGDILGHAGFPQSMAIVADALGLAIERIDRFIEPILTKSAITLAKRPIKAGHSAGVRQVYTAIVNGQPWYTARFTGHVAPTSAGLTTCDEIEIQADGGVHCTLAPGIGAQLGSAAMVSNSVDRVIAAGPGWATVADLPPAFPRIHPPLSGAHLAPSLGQENKA